MLGLHTDDVIASSTRAIGQATNRQIVAFRGSAGEDDFPGVGMDRLGDGATRLLHGVVAFPTEHVAGAAGVAELLA